ncbi:MAG: outer membrane lipoprotein carrier protein LolA [Candidatus Aegiribacteria sp.]|nr:outer membrane lipoprotein carrier protein LolA [Candidatus Aegiribacteria sp.]
MLYICLLISIASSSSLNPLLEKMKNTVFMTGSFIQTDSWALTLEEETSSGTMYLGHPDLFLLSYTEPAGAAMGYDGSVLYTVEADLQQVILYSSGEPGSFLHMLEKCADSTIAETLQFSGDSLIILLEGDFGEGISRMKVGFTLSDSLPFLFSTTDYNGNRTEYSIWNLTTDDYSPENVFQLIIPDGYTVVNPEEM